MHLKKTKKIRNKVKYFIVFIICFIILFLFKNSHKFFDVIYDYAETLAKDETRSVINKNIFKIDNDLDLYKISRNDLNEIEMIDYNSSVLNEYLTSVSQQVEKSLNDKFKDTSLKIPMGVITNNPLLSNYGPKVSARLTVLNSVRSNIRVNVKDYGINNALIEMILVVDCDVRVLLPITSKNIKVTFEAPISYKIISAKVPNYFSTYPT